MSFIIKTNAYSAFATGGVQERHAQNRHTARQKSLCGRREGAFADSCDLTHLGTGATAIREEAAFQADLSENLSFLQTQDFALGRIQDLFATCSKPEDFLDIFESLRGEKFNGRELFTPEGEEQALHLLAAQSTETVCIRQPIVSMGSRASFVQNTIVAAREENQKEQAQLREISASAKIQSERHAASVTILDSESARETTELSQRCVLSNASTALSGQANSAHEAVLRLFS